MAKNKISLDFWEDMPREMKKYLKNYGYHFNHKLYKFAVENMYRKKKDGSKEKIEPSEKDKVDEVLKKHNITLENNVMYDAAYVYSMALADFFGKSLPNEQYVAMWVKDKIDDVDQPDGYIMNEWYAKMCFAGIPIDWEEFV
jgi:hypothetical protein